MLCLRAGKIVSSAKSYQSYKNIKIDVPFDHKVIAHSLKSRYILNLFDRKLTDNLIFTTEPETIFTTRA